MSSTADHDDPDSAYRRFEAAIEWPMLALSLVFVALLIVPSLVEVDSGAVELGLAMIWGLFAAEVVALFLMAPSKAPHGAGAPVRHPGMNLGSADRSPKGA